MTINIINADVFDGLSQLSDESVNCVVTSPPYWGLRSYLPDGHPDKALEIGCESTLDAYIDRLTKVFREVRRVLRGDGTLWLNIGDSYAGSWGAQSRGDDYPGTLAYPSKRMLSGRQISAAQRRQSGAGSTKRTPGLKPKDLMMTPARLAIALQDDGWWLRSEIVWWKPNGMPESCTDRPTAVHEKIFLLSKGRRYWYDAEAVKEQAFDVGRENGRAGRDEDPRARPPGSNPKTGRNLRNVWDLPVKWFAEAHFATFPPEIPERCILAGCPVGGTVLDPFGGSGTTGLVADRLGRSAILIELNPEYCQMAKRRINGDAPLFACTEISQ